MKKVRLFLLFMAFAFAASAQFGSSTNEYDNQYTTTDEYSAPLSSDNTNTTTSSTSSFFMIHCSVCGKWHYPPACTPPQLMHCGVCGQWHYPPTCTTPPPTHVPIDGGLGLLLVAGAAYGAKRFRRKKEN